MRHLSLGPLTLDVPAIQGALSGFSDLAMRRVARAFGCVYAMNEVVLDELVVSPGRLQEQILRVADDDHPVGGQLLGATPEVFAKAARLLVRAGYDVIDINMGCPVKKVLGRSRGGALLSEPRRALEIVERVRAAVRAEVPVTVKMRRGSDDSAQSEEMFWEILEGAFARGVAAVCVHGRTVEQRYIGPSQRSFLARVKERFADRVILGSGDLFHAHDVRALLSETGVDGAWIARGAIGAPWIFNEVRVLLETGVTAPPPSFCEQRRAVWLHHKESLAIHGREVGSRLFRSVAVKYAEAHPASAQVLQALYACRNPDEMDALLVRFYDEALAEDAFGPVVRRAGPGNLVAAGALLHAYTIAPPPPPLAPRS
jgi:tRNA-dihydrouridine synthase B